MFIADPMMGTYDYLACGFPSEALGHCFILTTTMQIVGRHP